LLSLSLLKKLWKKLTKNIINAVNDLVVKENVDKARKTALELIAVRHYMATIAPYAKFTKKDISRWAATPAYSGRNVAK